jgi:hypothetical protein
MALVNDVTGAAHQQEAQRRAFSFLTLCKKHIETREVRLTS